MDARWDLANVQQRELASGLHPYEFRGSGS